MTELDTRLAKGSASNKDDPTSGQLKPQQKKKKSGKNNQKDGSQAKSKGNTKTQKHKKNGGQVNKKKALETGSIQQAGAKLCMVD